MEMRIFLRSTSVSKPMCFQGVIQTMIFAFICSGGNSVSHAATTRLSFDATVIGPISGATELSLPSWPFSIQPGDVVSGSFTFEPYDAASNVERTTRDEPFGFVVHIKSQTLTASHYGIDVYDNVLANDEFSELIDTVSMGRAFFEIDASLGNTGVPIEWAFLLGLKSEPIVLDGADIPADPLIWQQFLLQHSFDVYLHDPVAPGVYGFGATINSFYIAPEPATWVLHPLAMNIVVYFRQRDRRSLTPPFWPSDAP